MLLQPCLEEKCHEIYIVFFYRESLNSIFQGILNFITLNMLQTSFVISQTFQISYDSLKILEEMFPGYCYVINK